MPETSPAEVTTPQPPVQPIASAPQPVKSGGGNSVLILIVLVLILVLVIGGVVLVSELNKKNASTNYTENSNTKVTPTNKVEDKNDSANYDDESSTSEEETNSNSEDTENPFDFGNLSADLPSDFPKDVEILAGSKVTVSSSTQTEINVMFTTDKSAEEVKEFYKSSVGKNGWDIVSEQSMFGYSLTATKDSRELTVLIFEAGEGDENLTSFTIAVASN